MPSIALKVIEGSMKGEEFLFENTGLCLIGRDSNCSICIPREKDVGISRRHSLLIITDSKIRIRDLYSTNGTYVNGHRLIPSPIGDDPEKEDPNDRFLADGDKISVSNIVMEVQIKADVESCMKTATVQLEDPIPTTQTTKTRLIQFARGRTRSDSLIPEPNSVKSEKMLALETPLEDTHLFLSLPITEPIPRPKLWNKKEEKSKNKSEKIIKKTEIKEEEKTDTKKGDEQMTDKPDISIITGKPSTPPPEKETHNFTEEIKKKPEIEAQHESAPPPEKTVPQEENIPVPPPTEQTKPLAVPPTASKEQPEPENSTPTTEDIIQPIETAVTEKKSTEKEVEENSPQKIPLPQNEKSKQFDTGKMMALEKLAGTLASDFNEQFLTIINQAELLKEENDKNKITEYGDTIIRTAQLSLEMIDQLMMFAYNNADDLEANEKVNLGEVLTEIVSVMKHTAGRKIKILYTPPAHPNTLFTTGHQLDIHEALLNIAFNALESISGTGELSFKLQKTVLIDEDIAKFAFSVEPGSFIKITIEDSGTGIKDQNLSRIFDPYFTTKSEDDALGMGLTIAYGIIKSHKGTIEIPKTSEDGSTFEIYFPLSEQKE